MLRVAVRNLIQSKTRLLASTGGVALALVLILALDAIVAGIEAQIPAYIEHAGADVFVSQAGVRTLHMSASSLPAADADLVRAEPGVASVTPILYMTNIVGAGHERALAYVIGLPPDAAAGRPWRIAQGKGIPGPGEAVIDSSVARAANVGIGDPVTILGQRFSIVGLATGTANLINSVAFISFGDFAQLRGSEDTVSFLLVKVRPGASAVATRIERDVAGVTAQTRDAFASQERSIVDSMSTDLVTIMNLVGFVIGLAVMALTIYTAMLTRRQEFGILKAIGARNGDLYRAVLAQALLSVALAFALGLMITLALAAVVPLLGVNLILDVRIVSLLQVAGLALIIAGISAVLPIWQIAALDPAMVFKGR